MNDSPFTCNPTDPIMLDACVFRRYIGLDRLEISSKLQLRFDSEIGLIFRKTAYFMRNVYEDDSLHGNYLHGDFCDQTKPTQDPNFSPFLRPNFSPCLSVLVIVLVCNITISENVTLSTATLDTRYFR